MEWKVGNALSRDVERQHLNKILAEIKAAIATASTQVQPPVTNTISTVTRYAVARFTLSLDGDVIGSALVDGTGDVTLNTTLSGSAGVEEAPIDNQYYMRWNGEWVAKADVALTEGVYGDATHVVQITVNDNGQISSLEEVEIEASGTGGVLPVVTGDVPPELVYLEDGSLVYFEVD